VSLLPRLGFDPTIRLALGSLVLCFGCSTGGTRDGARPSPDERLAARLVRAAYDAPSMATARGPDAIFEPRAPGDRPLHDVPDAPSPLGPMPSNGSRESTGLRALLDAMGPWPIVSVEEGGVLLDGVVIAALPQLDAASRPQKVDALYEKLLARGISWRDEHPGAVHRVAGLRVSRALPAGVTEGVVQTMAFAGYPFVWLQSAESPEIITELAAQLPGSLTSAELPRAPRPPTLVVRLGERGAEILPGDAAIRPRPIPAALPELGEALCQAWRSYGRHKDVDDPGRDRLVFETHDALPTDVLMTASASALTCTRPQNVGPGSPIEVPAFWLQISLRR
jgi:hypothetical protein